MGMWNYAKVRSKIVAINAIRVSTMTPASGAPVASNLSQGGKGVSRVQFGSGFCPLLTVSRLDP